MRPDGASAPIAAQPDPPEELICPITACLMEDPVITTDGFTYERVAIAQWLETQDTSPLTGEPLPSKALLPNHLARASCQRYREEVCNANAAAALVQGGRGGLGLRRGRGGRGLARGAKVGAT